MNLDCYSANTYDEICDFLNKSKFKNISTFFNLGFVAKGQNTPIDQKLLQLLFNKNSIRLILETIGNENLNGQKVLDIGCWRGGTISVINKFFQPSSIVGIDKSSSSIAFCKEYFSSTPIAFICGDATDLPVNIGCFNFVLMV